MKIGPVVKRDVMKASVMLEHEEKYTVILAFDVRVERDAQELADSLGVKIFQVSSSWDQTELSHSEIKSLSLSLAGRHHLPLI